jgi:hypothetical protein
LIPFIFIYSSLSIFYYFIEDIIDDPNLINLYPKDNSRVTYVWSFQDLHYFVILTPKKLKIKKYPKLPPNGPSNGATGPKPNGKVASLTPY